MVCAKFSLFGLQHHIRNASESIGSIVNQNALSVDACAFLLGLPAISTCFPVPHAFHATSMYSVCVLIQHVLCMPLSQKAHYATASIPEVSHSGVYSA